jgi:tetratricopeptide (TPR) repeat protein
MKKLFFIVAIGLMGSLNAQIKNPQPSPTATISQAVGISNISIEYSRPGVKGREIFGGLVPYEKIWRTGANKATKITFGEDAIFGGVKVKKGAYSLFTIPGKEEWTILLNSETEMWGAGDYDEAKEVCNLKIKSGVSNEFKESFTIDFANFKSFSSQLILSWANTKVIVPIKTMAAKKIEKQYIDLLKDGPSANTYYNGARFFHENNLDLELALNWINNAVNKREDAFWMHYHKACILEKLGSNKEAIETAKAVIKMAKEKEDDYGYINKSEKLIEEIKAK